MKYNDLRYFSVEGDNAPDDESIMINVYKAMDGKMFASEPREFAILKSRLDVMDVEYEENSLIAAPNVVLYRLIFRSPNGDVSAVCMPGSIGAEKGLLESWCDGYDAAPMGNMTAVDVVERYFWGGWK